MRGGASDGFTTSLQVIAVLCAVLVCSMILHKGFTDVSALAGRFSGAEFWQELARYVLRNLGA
jgi:hypothetical protein